MKNNPTYAECKEGKEGLWSKTTAKKERRVRDRLCVSKFVPSIDTVCVCPERVQCPHSCNKTCQLINMTGCLLCLHSAPEFLCPFGIPMVPFTLDRSQTCNHCEQLQQFQFPISWKHKEGGKLFIRTLQHKHIKKCLDAALRRANTWCKKLRYN